MFQAVLSGNPRLLALSARDHALINAAMADAIATCFRDHDWTCHVCGIRLEGLMEVDHLQGHRPSRAADVAPICQFCHDLRHPVWAMSRKRAFPIHAPGIEQRSLTRFAWTLLSEMTRETGEDSFESIMEAIGERETAAHDMLEGENMEAALEAILVLRDKIGLESVSRTCRELDAHIRFLPTCLRDGGPILRWTPAGFRPLPVNLIHDAIGPAPDFSQLSRAAAELSAESC